MVVDRSSSLNLIPTRKVVQFIHQSVKDFFIAKSLRDLHSSMDSCQDNTSGVTGVEEMAHHQLWQTCISISYLATDEIESILLDARWFKYSFEHAFLLYAAEWWVTHVRQNKLGGISQNERFLEHFEWPHKTQRHFTGLL
ncbi:hypothetical protein B0T25DRAFT_224323 [Lasiosphaeria hispida]|uniref:Uncharacterized protein n=1 Tax=Lasiosphaeria hispida TaxID=260671 RepID=A0AAJ0MEZ4_9PEZI|nr:hypothetical protein B0T25DRAFT_224323 [Lasiosphaeria hispida]